MLKIHVVPNSSCTKEVGAYNGYIKIKIQSVAKDNEANDELIKFLARKYNISKNKIKILSGNKNNKKIVEIII